MRLRPFAATVWLIAGVLLLAVCLNASRGTAGAAAQADLDRGQYLTGDAGQCSDCHGVGLKGAPLMFAPKSLPPGVPFQDAAPNIAGLTMFASDDDAVKFFITGLLPNGQKARPPMPQYRFNELDARAIVAYLRSLKT